MGKTLTAFVTLLCYFIINAGERSTIVRRDDNLHPEGEFHKRPDQVWAPGDRANVIRRDDNLQPEGDFSKRPDATWAPGMIFAENLNV